MNIGEFVMENVHKNVKIIRVCKNMNCNKNIVIYQINNHISGQNVNMEAKNINKKIININKDIIIESL